MTTTRKILAIVTNTHRFESVGYRTGLWLGELVEFHNVATDAGFDVVIASPAGGYVPIDPESLLISQLGETIGLKGSVGEKYQDSAFMRLLDDTVSIAECSADDFDAIYLTGGHGVMFDFPDNPELQQLIQEFDQRGKIVSAVCHGVAGLLNVTGQSGRSLVEGRELTGFSWNEELAAKRGDAAPFNLEEKLRERGATYTKALVPFKSHVVEDGTLITGQNPASAGPGGEAVIKRLTSA